MLDSSDDTPVLTVAGFRQLQEEQEADKRLLKELPRRMERRQQKLDAVLLLAPHLAGISPQTGAPKERQRLANRRQPSLPLENEPQIPARSKSKFRGKTTWTSAIEKALKSTDRGLTHKELRAELSQSGMSRRLAISDKGFYGAIGKLADTKRLVKSGGLLYSTELAEKLEKTGSLPDMTTEARQRGGSSTSLVLEVLGQFQTGLTGAQLKQLVAAKPNAPKSIQHHGQYIYNVLATLIGAGQVVKDGALYKLASKKGGANGAGNTVGSVAHAS